MSSNKLDSVRWMYEGAKSTINTEEYLTGRKVDRAFDKSHAESQASSDTSKLDTVLSQKTLLAKNLPSAHHHQQTVLDLEMIKKEDPLVAIKTQEEIVRREIFQNPIKMKRLQKIVMAAMRKKVKKMARKGEMPDFIQAYFAASLAEQAQQASENNATSDDESDDGDQRRPNGNSSDEDRKRPKKFGLVYVKKEPMDRHESTRSKAQTQEPTTPTNQDYRRSGPKRKLSEREMEAKRREMMDNAKWRDEQRHFRQRRYEEEERRENQSLEEEKGGKGAQFLKPMVSKSMQSKTVGDRIRSKKHSIQRGHDSMDKNFARK